MTDGLFPEPERVLHELSKMYDTGHHRMREGRKSKWTKYAARGDCQECFALQHESYVPGSALRAVREQAVLRRSIAGGPDLLLCHPHAQLWRERDEDQVGK